MGLFFLLHVLVHGIFIKVWLVLEVVLKDGSRFEEPVLKSIRFDLKYAIIGHHLLHTDAVEFLIFFLKFYLQGYFKVIDQFSICLKSKPVGFNYAKYFSYNK